jgi:hypothetical protein
MLAKDLKSLMATHIAQDLSTEKFAEFEVMDRILVLRDTLFLTVDQLEGIQQVSRCDGGFCDAVLHRFLLFLQVERLSFLLFLVFFGLRRAGEE